MAISGIAQADQSATTHIAAAPIAEEQTSATSIPTSRALRFSVVDATNDPAWDAFVATAPGGHYAQSSLWAKIKATQGWQARHVIGRDSSGQIVAGAQILLKRVRRVATIAVAYKAPLIAVADPDLAAWAVTAIHHEAKRLRPTYFTMQPAEGGERVAGQLQTMGYRPAPGLGHTPATTVFDLTQDLETILQRMHKSTRRGVRIGQRSGLTMREGGEADLELFHRLLVDASRRIDFDTHPLEFFRRLWHIGAPQGQVRLFFVELDGEPLATEISLAIGDTVYGFKAARSGAHEKAHPNEFLTWEILRWAKAHGFRRYDFVGIDSTPELAFKLATGELPREQLHQMHNFKLGFGGDVIFSPIAYEYIPNPALRYLYNALWHNERLGRLKHTASLVLRGMQHTA